MSKEEGPDFDTLMRLLADGIRPATQEDLGPEPEPDGAQQSSNGHQHLRHPNGRAQGPRREPAGSSSSSGGFTYISLAELLDRPEPAYRFVVDEMLPAAGSSLLVAKPKVGKTVLALQAARDVASGAAFLGRAVRQGPVLYHAFEEKDDEVARIMRRAAADRCWPIQFHFAEIPRDRIAALRVSIRQHRPTLVVIDTLAYWMQIEDFDDYGQVGRAMRPLHALARETDCHIMAVHHAGKSREGIDAALGSTALTANVDTIMVETEGEAGRTLEAKPRYGTKLPRTLLRFDAQTGCLSMGDSIAQSKARDFDAEVLTAVTDGSHLETQIRAALRCDRNRLLATLNALVTRGLLSRTGTGHRNSPYLYEVAQTPSSVEGEERECPI